MTSPFSIPRCFISAAISSAIASRLSGRSMSAVRPWACKSTAITRRVFESNGRIEHHGHVSLYLHDERGAAKSTRGRISVEVFAFVLAAADEHIGADEL